MNEGFIKLFRSLLDWEWYDDINVKVLFIHLLLKANYKDKNWRGIIIEKGSFITSYGILASEVGLSVMQIRTCLKKLNLTGEITTKTTNNYTIVKLKNYDKYNGDNTQNNNQITNEQQSNNNQITTTKKEKNINKEKNIFNYIDEDFEKSKIGTEVPTLQEKIKSEFDLEFLKEIYNKYSLNKETFKEECESFVLYWNETNDNGSKERWKKEKTFNTKLRFRTRMKNFSNWSKKPNNFTQKSGVVIVDDNF